MNKIEILNQEKLKSKVLLNNISNCLNNINYKIDELLKFKNQQENIIQKFEIKCFNYNIVDKMVESKEEFSKKIEQIILELKSLDIINDSYSLDFNINKIKNINDVLKNTEVQLKNIEKEDFSTVEKLQMNAIKKGIYDKFMLEKSEIDRAKFKKKFDKIQNRGAIAKAIDVFFEREDIVDMKKENMFFWREILFHQSSYRCLTYSYLTIFHKMVTKSITCTNLSIFQFDLIDSFVKILTS